MRNSQTYHIANREVLRTLSLDERLREEITMTKTDFQDILSLNDQSTLAESMEVYKPLTQIITIHHEKYLELEESKKKFLNLNGEMPPFIIGISGSVAVGKSTTARLLQELLQQFYPNLNVELMTTDGFLYPNEILEKNNMMSKKGFPESYDMRRLIAFLSDVKNNKEELSFPRYSHQVYDIIAGEKYVINRPDILIVEGINVLQLPSNETIYISDFFDLSLYVDADTDLIEEWYLQRFETLINRAKNRPEDYHYQFSLLPYEEAMARGRKVWRDINLVNLNNYILPTRNRADLVVHKIGNHHIDEIWIKKY